MRWMLCPARLPVRWNIPKAKPCSAPYRKHRFPKAVFISNGWNLTARFPWSAGIVKTHPVCTLASVAPSAGMKTGMVITDTDKCIGCWTCVMVCPYGVIGRHLEEHKAYRCDRCPDREIPAVCERMPYRGAGLRYCGLLFGQGS